MNKERIISAISIDLGLSKEKSVKAVNAVLSCVLKAIEKDNGLVIQKFGKFKPISGKTDGKKNSIKFTPAKKLAIRVNSDFKNLKKVKIKKNLKTAEKKFKKYDINLIKEDLIPDGSQEIQGWVNNSTDIQRTLISDQLINLHQEITKEITKDITKDIKKDLKK